MRIGMRLLLGYFLLVAVAAWFVLAIFVKEVKPGVRRATEARIILPNGFICRIEQYFALRIGHIDMIFIAHFVNATDISAKRAML